MWDTANHSQRSKSIKFNKFDYWILKAGSFDLAFVLTKSRVFRLGLRQGLLHLRIQDPHQVEGRGQVG